METDISPALISVGIEQLTLSPARPKGYVPQPTPALQQCITRYGVLSPIAVRPIADRSYEILTHPTTWVAAGRAGIHEVPVLVHAELTAEEAAEIVADHYQHERVDPIAEAEHLADELAALKRFESRPTVTGLARRLGLSRSQVAHSLRLLELPDEIRHLLREGTLSAGQARPLITVTDPKRQLKLAKRIVAESLSARDAEQLARGRKSAIAAQRPADNAANKDSDVRRLERQVSDLIGSPFEIRGQEAVFNFFGDYEVLDGLLSRLGYRDG